MITIENITKSFGSLQVLKGIDLHIDRGEVVSIVGPSGAGKTTLLQIIGTLDRPDSGSVHVDSVDVTTLSHPPTLQARRRKPPNNAPSTCCNLWDSLTAPATSPTSSLAARNSASP